jgi:hypothetical protein
LACNHTIDTLVLNSVRMIFKSGVSFSWGDRRTDDLV